MENDGLVVNVPATLQIPSEPFKVMLFGVGGVL